MKKRVISLLLCLVMALSLIPTVAVGAEKPTSVDHIDVLLALSINGKTEYLNQTDLNNITVTSSTSNHSITKRTLNGSTDANGQKQARFEGTFPVGTKENPVIYTLSLTKVVDGVSYDLTLTTNYWDADNFCPPTLKDQKDPSKGHNDTWTNGGVVKGSGIDVEFGTGNASTKQVIITKNIQGVDTADLAAGKSFTFTIYKEDGVTQVGSSLTATTTSDSLSSANAMTYLVPGTYVVKETASASYDNYTLSGTSYGGVAAASGTLVVGNNGGSLTVTNTYEKNAPPTGSLTIVKNIDCHMSGVDSDTTFFFKVMQGDTVIRDDVSVKVEIGAASGQTVVNLPVGDYTVVEISPVPVPVMAHEYSGTTYDYGKDATGAAATYATVTANGNSTVTVTNIYEPVYGEPIYKPATLTITKVDANDEDVLLTGAEFTLTRGETTLTSTDNGDGTYTISNIMDGTDNAEWTLTETKAPEGYQKSSQTWKVYVISEFFETISDDDDVFVKTVTYLISIGSKDFAEEDAWKQNQVMTITNEKEPPESYSVTLPIQKIVEKKDGSDNPGKTTFAFAATMVDGQTDTTTQYGTAAIVTNGVGTYDGTLKIEVPANLFTTDGTGEIMLQVSEVKGTDSKWSYDETVYYVLIKVENYEADFDVIPEIALLAMVEEQEPTKLTFTNTYSYKYVPTPKPVTPTTVTSVKTGDMGVALYAVTSLLSLSGAAVIIKKRKDEE